MPNERRIPIFGQAELVVTWAPDNDIGGRYGYLDGIEGYLKGLESNLKRPPGVLLDAVGAIMRRSFRRNFEMGGRPQWEPLKPGTVRRKNAAIGSGRIPRRTPTGRIPRRLLQVDRATGQKSFSGLTMLIASGKLRDSWCVKGAAGNVTDVNGPSLFVGSQHTAERTVTPATTVSRSLIFTKKAHAARMRGRNTTARVTVARIHELGAPRANIPARPVGLVQEEDLEAIRAAALEWVFG